MEYSKKESAIAIIRGIIPVIATVFTMFGISADANIMLTAVAGVVALVTFVWSWWKNNNITAAAQEAQNVLDELKSKESANGEGK